jgi:hypothetical protein
VIWGPGTLVRDTSGVVAAPVADAPPASAIDTPTNPATGTAFFRCFRFVCGIVETSHASGHCNISVLPTVLFVRLARTPCKITPHAGGAFPQTMPMAASEVVTGQGDDRCEMRPGIVWFLDFVTISLVSRESSVERPGVHRAFIVQL